MWCLPAVVLACRSKTKGEAVKSEIVAQCGKAGIHKPQLEIRILDLSSLEWVATGRLHVTTSHVLTSRKQRWDERLIEE